MADILADSDVILAGSFFVDASAKEQTMALTVTFDGTNIAQGTAAEETASEWLNGTITAAEVWTETAKQGGSSIGYQSSNKDGYGVYDYSGTGTCQSLGNGHP